MIIFKVTKSQGFIFSLKDTFLEKPQKEVKLCSIQSVLNSLQNGGALSFSQPYLCKQPTLQSPPKFFFNKFHLPILPLLVHKIILTISTNTHFFYASALFLRTATLTIYIKGIFPTLANQPIQAASRK